MIIREFSALILYDKNRKILLQYRGKEFKHMPEMWTFFGGKLEKNESKEDALKREIKEELDYDLKNSTFLVTKSNFWKKENREEKHIIHTFCKMISENNKENLKLLEGNGWAWFEKNKALKLNMPKLNKEVIELFYNRI